ncbi:ermin [Rhineura floridana]|uniref:ermin n=1 Tax=Rhineura floridana TaxID=261503 RepID=UPI002AC888DC|nr:ermin [Rhineura floridana]
MTEDIQAPASMSEYNRNVPSEEPQLQVIDIIDQIANSVEIFPYETAEPIPGFPLTQENQGVTNLVESTAYDVSVGIKENQGKPEGSKEKKTDVPSQETRDWEEESGEGLCEEGHPVSNIDHEVAKQEERTTQQPQNEKIYSTNKAEEEQEEVQLNEPEEPMKEETQLEGNETGTEEVSDGTEEGMQKENDGDEHRNRLENNSKDVHLASPSCTSQTEKSDEQPGSMKQNDVSRHSYSRYNTISYRKIRKGNTKQRIDEFESMMHS